MPHSRLETDDTRVDEETPLLGETTFSGPISKTHATPLPKVQIWTVLLLQMAEPMTSHCIYPFINQLVSELPITNGEPDKVGYYAGLIQSLFFATEALTVLHWSRISDRVGRKPVLMTGLFGLCISMILFGLSRTFWALVVTRCLAGALNGNIGVIKSTVGDLTDSSNMAQAFGMMPIVWATGVTVAPLIGGTLSRPHDRFPNVFRGRFWQKYPYFLPSLVSACYSGFAFLLALFVFKETLHKPKTATGKDTAVEEQDEGFAAQQASSSSSSPTSNNETVPLRQLLTPRVLLAIANYAMLAILDISLGALQPLYYSTPISLGGLGFSPAKIGLVMGMFGILNGILQGLFFSRIVGLVGLRRTFLISMGAFAPLFAMFPVINLVARARDVKVEVWALLVAQLLIWVIMDMSYGCVFMYITSSSPNKQSLGSVNGLAQLTASVVRTIGPVASTSLFAVTRQRDLLGGNLVYVVFVAVSCLAVGLGSKLPGEAWDMEDHN